MLEDPTGLDELRRLGARSVPVLSRGDDYVFAQNIGHVVKFLGLNEATGPVLSPDQLIERIDRFLDAGIRMIPQMPDAKLATEVPNRPRSYRVLGHHIFRIAETFLEVANGATLEYAGLTSTPPDTMQTTADIVAYGSGCEAAAGRLVGVEAGQVGARNCADLLRPADAARIPGAQHVACRPARAPVEHAARHGRHRGGPSAGRRRFRRSADAKPGVGRITRDPLCRRSRRP